MASSKTRNAAEFVANRFEAGLKAFHVPYKRQAHRTDGIAFYFTKPDFIRGVDWTIRIADHAPQGRHKDKPKYYSITYRNIDHAIPELQLQKAFKIFIGE